MFRSILQKYLTGGFCGHDKEGSRVRVELYGHLDMKGIMYSAKKVDLEKTKLWQCESTVQDWREQSKLRGSRVDGLTVIFDMEGVSSKMLWRPGLQMYLHLVKVLEDNYPEMMKRMFVVNAPRIFPLLYKLCRPLISEDMKNKIHVLGGNFKETLLKYIDAEELPVFLGGTKTDPDGNPRCATMICQGGPVPREYFLQNRDSDDQLETATVSRGEKLCLQFEVTKPGSVLRWEFKTDDFDIGFGVFLKTDKGREAVYPVERVNSHMVPEDGSVTCQQTGTYEVVFDNSFSWARGKRVQYMVEVIGPVDDGMRGEITSMMLGQGDTTWDTISDSQKKSYRAPDPRITEILKAKTPKEKAALEQFKERVADIRKPDHDDYELYKWLIAREYNVSKAEEMYRNSMAYREKMRVDTILKEYTCPEVLKKYLTGGFCGHDKEGSPVRVELYGYLDMKGIMYSAKKIDLEKAKIVECETIVQDWRQQSKLRGRRVDGLCLIFDMEHTKMPWRPGLQMYLTMVMVLEDNYPEMMKRMFVVNAPRIFPLIYKLVRTVMTEHMRKKIHVLTPSNTKETLLKYIDAEELPAYLGGLKTDPDGNPRCATMIGQGGPVPKEYYLQTSEGEDQMEIANVSRGSKVSLPFEISKPGSAIRWEFKTDDYDIGFGVFLKTDKGRKEVQPVERVNSHMVPADGSIVCQETGTYEVVFDNSFSWTRGKRVQYSIDVIDPVDDTIQGELSSMLLAGANVDWDAIAENPNIETTKF
ncbi:hypothetical protein BaRGS_00009659 [Batillaria attramentaria]|uniref:SEC14-like protein 2 n=1 Tax=Batillaria attramentaria TaxID=370345 RepID=A0ABD0LHT5_9CAEN